MTSSCCFLIQSPSLVPLALNRHLHNFPIHKTLAFRTTVVLMLTVVACLGPIPQSRNESAALGVRTRVSFLTCCRTHCNMLWIKIALALQFGNPCFNDIVKMNSWERMVCFLWKHTIMVTSLEYSRISFHSLLDNVKNLSRLITFTGLFAGIIVKPSQ